VNIFKTAENALPDAVTDPSTKALLDSVQIEHRNERAVVTATIPVALLQKLTRPDQPSPASP
jgi:hypothetical protein